MADAVSHLQVLVIQEAPAEVVVDTKVVYPLPVAQERLGKVARGAVQPGLHITVPEEVAAIQHLEDRQACTVILGKAATAQRGSLVLMDHIAVEGVAAQRNQYCFPIILQAEAAEPVVAAMVRQVALIPALMAVMVRPTPAAAAAAAQQKPMAAQVVLLVGMAAVE